MGCRTGADDDGQRGETAGHEGDDFLSLAIDHDEFPALLPDRIGAVLGDADLDAAGEDLGDRGPVDPGHRLQRLAGRGRVERDQALGAGLPQRLQNVDFRGLGIADDVDVLDREAQRLGDGIDHGDRMAALDDAVDDGCADDDGREAPEARQRQMRHIAGQRRDPAAEARGAQHQPAGGTRPRVVVVIMIGPVGALGGHRRHEASSTIQLRSSGKL